MHAEDIQGRSVKENLNSFERKRLVVYRGDTRTEEEVMRCILERNKNMQM